MNKLVLALRSRTVWVVILLAAINTIPQLQALFPDKAWLDTLNGLLALLAGYFRVNPRTPSV